MKNFIKLTIDRIRRKPSLVKPVVSESLLREAIYLLSIKQPDNCPNWIKGVGDCNKPECEFCRIQRCIDELESNVTNGRQYETVAL